VAESTLTWTVEHHLSRAVWLSSGISHILPATRERTRPVVRHRPGLHHQARRTFTIANVSGAQPEGQSRAAQGACQRPPRLPSRFQAEVPV
jgi:hypothetical protein